MMEYLPINLQLNQQPCVVIGGGNIALRKTKTLMAAGAKITLVSLDIHSELIELANQGKLVAFNSPYQKDFLNNQRLVIAATDNQQINQQVYQDALELNLLINVVDQPHLCNFIMSSLVNRGPLSVAISSSGTAPVLARMLREKLEWMLPESLTEQLIQVKALRPKIAKRIPDFNERRAFWESYFEAILDWSVSGSLMQQDVIEMDESDIHIEALINRSRKKQQGLSCIDLGDCQSANLIAGTLQKLHKADAIYCIGEVPDNILSLCRKDAEVISVEKEIFQAHKINLGNFSDLMINLQLSSQVCLLASGNRFEENWQLIESAQKEGRPDFKIQLNRALPI